MSLQQNDNQENRWQELDSLLEISLGGNSEPLNDYLWQNEPSQEWREMAVEHLIETSGRVGDGITAEKVWLIQWLCNHNDQKHAAELIAFFEIKWDEFCNLKRDESTSEQEQEYVVGTAHGLLGILSSLCNEAAIKYLEKIMVACENKNEHFRLAAAEHLAHAKQRAKLRSTHKP